MVVAAGRTYRGSGAPIEMILDPDAAHSYSIASYGNDDAIGSPTFPLASLAEARTRVRVILPTQSRDLNVRIYDRPVDSVLTLRSQDSGQNGYKAIWHGGHTLKSTVEGHIENGTVITGWALFDAENDIWVADYDGPFCRSIWVDNVRCLRGRRGGGLTSPTWTETGYTAAGDAILTENDYTDVVLLYNDLNNNFNEPHNKVASRSGNNITMIDPAHTYITVFPGLSRIGWTAGYATKTTPQDVEGCWADFVANATPGTFHYARIAGSIYYIPREGEDLTTDTVLAPGEEEVLLDIEGASDIDIARLGVYRAGFAMTEGYAERASGFLYDSTHIPSDGGGGNYGADGGNTTLGAVVHAVRLVNNTRVRLLECRVKHHEAGGVHSYGNTDCTINGDLIDDTGSNSLTVGDYTELEASTCTDGQLIDNLLTVRAGQMYRGAVGTRIVIFTRSTARRILCKDMPYNGLMNGFGGIEKPEWTDKVEDCLIERVELDNCMGSLIDGAALYVINAHNGDGDDAGLVVQDIYAHDINPTNVSGAPVGAGYMDNKANGVTFRRWVIKNSRDVFVFNDNASGNVNVVEDNYADENSIVAAGTQPTTLEALNVSGDPVTTTEGAAIVAIAKPDAYYLNIYAGELP
jgi:hypothetical protein